METRTSSTATAAAGATRPNIDSLWRGRAISQQESCWIAGQRSAIEDAATSIHGLADMLTAVIELSDSDVDPYYRRVLGWKGAMSLGYAIQTLAEKILDHQREIERTLDGTALAEHGARMAWDHKLRVAEAARRRAGQANAPAA